MTELQTLTVIQPEIPPLVSTAVASARLAEIRAFVRSELKEGIDQDYAIIPGTGQKPSLLQPGAEKLMEKLGLSPTFPETRWVYEDHDKGEYMVDVLCRLVNIYTERVQAECWGSAGRSAQEEINASNAKAREYKKPERMLGFRDRGLARNTAFKLAQKSALVGATLKAARLAVEFTQDVEDFTRTAPTKSPQTPQEGAGVVSPLGMCPIHHKPFVEGKFGPHCTTKVGDGWCKEKPKTQETAEGNVIKPGSIIIPAGVVAQQPAAAAQSPEPVEDAGMTLQEFNVEIKKLGYTSTKPILDALGLLKWAEVTEYGYEQALAKLREIEEDEPA